MSVTYRPDACTWCRGRGYTTSEWTRPDAFGRPVGFSRTAKCLHCDGTGTAREPKGSGA